VKLNTWKEAVVVYVFQGTIPVFAGRLTEAKMATILSRNEYAAAITLRRTKKEWGGKIVEYFKV
jgi:hypothetical protein